MSVLLRHPATVPALFSRGAAPEPRADEDPSPWRRLAGGLPLGPTAAWIAVLLVDVPLVRAAAASSGLALPG